MDTLYAGIEQQLSKVGTHLGLINSGACKSLDIPYVFRVAICRYDGHPGICFMTGNRKNGKIRYRGQDMCNIKSVTSSLSPEERRSTARNI